MEWLANLSVKWVLVAVGVLMVALATVRMASPPRDQTGLWLVENVQVILSVVVVVFLIIRPFLFQAFYIPSTSMEPTLHGPPDHPVGDRLLVNKLIYRVRDPQRSDIAVFRAPPQASPDEKEFIKRVIGLPNETVAVLPPRLVADGKTALVLTTEGSAATVSGVSVDQDRVTVDPSGTSAEMSHKYSGTRLRVVTAPLSSIRYDPYRVEVNGKVELEDPSGRIRRVDGLDSYGADPGVPGAAFTMDEDPRLAVVDARKLVREVGRVVINDRELQEGYLAEPPNYAMSARKLGPDEYFMMGDNRNNSNDSHVWGPLTRDRIIGRAEIVFWPANRFTIMHWWLIAALAGIVLAYEVGQRLLRPRRRGDAPA